MGADRKGFLYKAGAGIGVIAMRLMEECTRFRGTANALSIGRIVGSVLWPLGAGRRRLALRNAEVALPSMPVRERRRVVGEAVVDTTAFWPELINYRHFGPSRITRAIEVEGLEHLRTALAKGRGVIAPSVHLGNFSLIGIWMSAVGIEFYFLTRYPHDPRMVRRFIGHRKAMGIGAIRDRPKRACMRAIFEALKRNAVVFMQLDQPARDTGADVQFFGRSFHAFTGPVAVALKTGAAVVPMYIVRDEGTRHRLVIEPEVEMISTGDRQADIVPNLQALMHRFEGWITRRPDQWWWFNRKWKGV